MLLVKGLQSVISVEGSRTAVGPVCCADPVVVGALLRIRGRGALLFLGRGREPGWLLLSSWSLNGRRREERSRRRVLEGGTLQGPCRRHLVAVAPCVQLALRKVNLATFGGLVITDLPGSHQLGQSGSADPEVLTRLVLREAWLRGRVREREGFASTLRSSASSAACVFIAATRAAVCPASPASVAGMSLRTWPGRPRGRPAVSLSRSSPLTPRPTAAIRPCRTARPLQPGERQRCGRTRGPTAFAPLRI